MDTNGGEEVEQAELKRSTWTGKGETFICDLKTVQVRTTEIVGEATIRDPPTHGLKDGNGNTEREKEHPKTRNRNSSVPRLWSEGRRQKSWRGYRGYTEPRVEDGKSGGDFVTCDLRCEVAGGPL